MKWIIMHTKKKCRP